MEHNLRFNHPNMDHKEGFYIFSIWYGLDGQQTMISIAYSPEKVQKKNKSFISQMVNLEISVSFRRARTFQFFDILSNFSGLQAIDFTQSAAAGDRIHTKC